MVAHALAHCPHNRTPDRRILEGLIAIEKEAGLPAAARGLLLAAACRESGFRAHPGYGDNGMSAGMFQFASWAKKRIRRHRTPGYRGDVRLDWRAAARFWAHHVAKQVKSVRAYCKGSRGYKSHESMVWASANTSAVRAPSCKSRRADGRCTSWVPRCARRGRRSETLHWKTRHSWSKIVRAKLAAPVVAAPMVPDA